MTTARYEGLPLEVRVVTNAGHCASLVHATVLGADGGATAQGVSWRGIALVLPLCCHGASVRAVLSKRGEGLLARAIESDRSWAVGLPERIHRFFPATIRALHLAHCSGLIHIDRSGGTLTSSVIRKTLLPTTSEPRSTTQLGDLQAADAVKAARVWGRVLSELGERSAWGMLGLRNFQ